MHKANKPIPGPFLLSVVVGEWREKAAQFKNTGTIFSSY